MALTELLVGAGVEGVRRGVVHLGVYFVHDSGEVTVLVQVAGEVRDVCENGRSEFVEDEGEREMRLHGKFEVLQRSGPERRKLTSVLVKLNQFIYTCMHCTLNTLYTCIHCTCFNER